MTHPNLINLDTGDEYEWITEPAGGGEPGYAHEGDHDFAWSRTALESDGSRLAEVDSLDPALLTELRARYAAGG